MLYAYSRGSVEASDSDYHKVCHVLIDYECHDIAVMDGNLVV